MMRRRGNGNWDYLEITAHKHLLIQWRIIFPLRSGQEHRRLRHGNSQMKLFEPLGGRLYLYCQEDKSITNQGSIKHMIKVPKEVTQYANLSDPSRCFVWLYEENNRCYPVN